MASFMNETCRRTAWPSEAADCSAARSGSASRTATSVMAEDINFSSWARQASSARNQNSAIGSRRWLRRPPSSDWRRTSCRWRDVGASHGPRQQGADGKPAARCRRRQLEGAAGGLLLQSEDQAADGGRIVVGGNLGARRTRWPALGGAPARLVARRRRPLPSALPTLLPGFSEPSPPWGSGGGVSAVSRETASGAFRRCLRLFGRDSARGALGGLALRLSVLSHSPFQFRRRAGHRTP